MKTVKELKEFLSNFPSDYRVNVYEGEVSGIVIFNLNGEQEDFFDCDISWSDEDDEEEKKELENYLDNFWDEYLKKDNTT